MPIKAPKGAASASDTKAAKINSTSDQMQKKRRSHDPNRSLNGLPVAQIIKSNYSIDDNQTMSKGLLIVLASMAGINKIEQLPNGKAKYLKTSYDYSPTINSFDDFISWVNTLTFDNGFIIVTLNGSTGVGTCISRGPYMGNPFHITSGGLTYANKKGSHILLCGTNSNRAAHAFVDLSDPFVKHVVPALNRLGVIKLESDSDTKGNGTDAIDEVVSFMDDISTDVSYPLMLDVAKIINPKLIYKRANVKKNHMEKKKPVIQKKKVEDYMANMNLPSDNEEDEEDEEDEDDQEKEDESKDYQTKGFKTVRINDSITSFKKNYEEEGTNDDNEDNEDNDADSTDEN
jgi:hypothetical protein